MIAMSTATISPPRMTLGIPVVEASVPLVETTATPLAATSTLTEGIVASAPAPAPAVTSRVSLIKAFALRTGASIASAANVAWTTVQNWFQRILGYLPTGLLQVAAPIAAMSRTVVHSVVEAGSWVVRQVGRFFGWMARMAHKAMNWIGDRVVDAVSIVSKDAGATVADKLLKFSDFRVKVANYVKDVAATVFTWIHDAFDSNAVFRVVQITGALITLGAVAAMFAPAAAAWLGTVPGLNWFTLSGTSALTGSWSALGKLGIAMGSAAAGVLVRTMVENRADVVNTHRFLWNHHFSTQDVTEVDETPATPEQETVPAGTVDPAAAKAEADKLHRAATSHIGRNGPHTGGNQTSR